VLNEKEIEAARSYLRKPNESDKTELFLAMVKRDIWFDRAPNGNTRIPTIIELYSDLKEDRTLRGIAES